VTGYRGRGFGLFEGGGLIESECWRADWALERRNDLVLESSRVHGLESYMQGFDLGKGKVYKTEGFLEI